jgi:hypothetical protein
MISYDRFQVLKLTYWTNVFGTTITLKRHKMSLELVSDVAIYCTLSQKYYLRLHNYA